MARGDERIPIIDLVRFASILLVFSIHFSSSQLARAPETPWLASAWLHVVRNGAYGVSLFFVVSGFVITRSIVLRNPDLATLDLRGFYARRAGRILPPFFLSVLVGVAIVLFTTPRPGAIAYVFHNGRTQFDAPFFLSLLTFSFNWLRIARRATTQTFGLHWDILWSLAVEEQFYAAYPLLLRTLKTRRSVVLFLVLVALLGPVARLVSIGVDPGSFLVSFTNSFVCFDLLAMGALLFYVLEWLPKPKAGPLEPFLGLAALGTLTFVYASTSLADPDERVWSPSLIGLSLAAFLGVGIRLRWLDGKLGRALVDPGQVSYGAYLFHPLVLFLGWSFLRGQSTGVAFGLFAALTLGGSYALYAYYEKPMNRRLRALLVGGLR